MVLLATKQTRALRGVGVGIVFALALAACAPNQASAPLKTDKSEEIASVSQKASAKQSYAPFGQA